ncbi:MAG: isoaspartyl peptidase/L-asparaginase [Actinobacteria bacterium]|nr:MAG: isoaspartyl peptidase/L-asparaginase [Actinomycetota bacterium]
MAEPALAVHGGAGGRLPSDQGPYHEALAAALDAGWEALAGGGALDAVEAAVAVLEDAPFFNAGRGSVLTAAGAVEMDAGIAYGPELRTGAVACVTRVRNPVRLARAVMERTPHVLLAGRGAEALAVELNLELMKPSWFVTARQRERFEAGTVGAVARDSSGALAAATSTGGTRAQLPGRVGDSPLIGAGLYVDDAAGAAGATGVGEEALRVVGSFVIVEAMRAGANVQAACEEAARRVNAAAARRDRGWRVGETPPATAIGP